MHCHSFKNLVTAAAIPALCLFQTLFAWDMLEQGHVDLVFDFDPDTALWDIAVDADDPPRFAPDDVFFHLNNYPVSGSSPKGNYVPSRPSGSQWDFIGVAEGEPFWFISAAGPSAGQISLDLGMNSEGTPLEAFIAYSDPADPRSAPAERWITVSLEEVRFQGEGAGHVALWTGNAEVIYWSTAQEPEAGNLYYLATGGHQHMNWAFSDPGIYEIDLKASGRRMDGSIEYIEESPVKTFFFAVGELPDFGEAYTAWAESHFTPAQIADGMGDADHDPFGRGVTNLIAYALGLDPHTASPADLARLYPPTMADPLTLEFQRSLTVRSLELSVERSETLHTWAGEVLARSINGGTFEALVAGISIVETDGPDGGMATVRIHFTDPQPSPFFLRLKADL